MLLTDFCIVLDSMMLDVDAKNIGRENTYVFRHGNNKVILKPAEKDTKRKAKSSSQVPSEHKIHYLSRREIERERQESDIVLAMVCKGGIEFPIESHSILPLEINQLLQEF